MSLFGVTDIGLFILAGLLLNITPGADLLNITNRSAMQGKKAGVVAVLGIGAGCLAHVLSLTTIFRQAILINILNPKAALFFLALLPQFVSPVATDPALTFLFLGACPGMPFCLISSLLIKNNARNIVYMAVLIFCKCLDFKQNAYSRTGS